MEKKNFTHISKESVDTELLKAEWLKESNSPVFEVDKDRNILEIKDHLPQRKFEFNSSGHFYLSDAAQYLCTHHKNALFLDDNVYIRSIVKRDKFFDITIGDFKEQYGKLMSELSKTESRRCYISNGEGGYYLMHPFMLIPESISLEKFKELPEKEKQKLTNISATRIEKFHFYFARPMFEKYLNHGQFYQHPVNLYAKIYDIVSKLNINDNTDSRFVAGKDFYPDIDYKELLPSPRFVAGYIKFFDYLYEHGAGSLKSISIDEIEIFKTCYPSLIKISKDSGMIIRDKKEYEAFFKMVVILTTCLDGFDYKLKGTPKDDPNKNGYRIFKFDHTQRSKEINQKYIKDGKR
jgi:hypothetical protein